MHPLRLAFICALAATVQTVVSSSPSTAPHLRCGDDDNVVHVASFSVPAPSTAGINNEQAGVDGLTALVDMVKSLFNTPNTWLGRSHVDTLNTEEHNITAAKPDPADTAKGLQALSDAATGWVDKPATWLGDNKNAEPRPTQRTTPSSEEADAAKALEALADMVNSLIDKPATWLAQHKNHESEAHQ